MLHSRSALTPASEQYYEIQNSVLQNYTFNWTGGMYVAWEYRTKGLGCPEIGRALARTQSTVCEYFIKMRQRYMAIGG